MKTCFISLPITNQENTVKERFLKAVEDVKKLGYKPVAPYDIEELINEIEHPDHTLAYLMGKDVEILIDCDAIYSCKGWEISKGCQIERKTAEVYGKILLEETPDVTLKDAYRNKLVELTRKYNNACSQYLLNSSEVKSARNTLMKFKNDMKEWFEIE